MYYHLIAKSLKDQFYDNYLICSDMFDHIFNFIDINTNQYYIDIILNKNLYNLKYYKKNLKPFIFSIPKQIINYDYILLVKTLNIFLFLFKRDIISILQYNSKVSLINVNNNNNEWFIYNNCIQNKNITINTIIYDHKFKDNKYYILIEINWKTTKLIYHILYKKVWEYVINHHQLFNNLNELVNIEYTTKIKKNMIKGKKNIKKIQILHFLKLFLDNFYNKLDQKYNMINYTHNFFDVSGINKTNLYLHLYLKLFNTQIHNTLNNNIISRINNNIKNIFIDNLYYII